MSDKYRAGFDKMNAFTATVQSRSREIIECLAGERGSLPKKAWFERAASRLGKSWARTYNIWRGRTIPRADEFEEMKACFADFDQRVGRLDKKHDEIREARAAARRIDADFGRVACAAISLDEEGGNAHAEPGLSGPEASSWSTVPSEP